MNNTQALLNDLARSKAIFQQRAILAAMECLDRVCKECQEYEVCGGRIENQPNTTKGSDDEKM